MKAKDLMSSVMQYLTPETTLCEAVTTMREIKRSHGLPIKGMLVKNERSKVVGILSIKDILATVIPSYLSPDISIFSWENMLEEMTARAADKKVADIMVKKVFTIDADAPLMECADLMIKKGVQRLPVTDDDGDIIGIVYIRDIFDIVADYLSEGGQKNGTC